MRKVYILISILCIVFSLSGCKKNVETKTFSRNGLEITLTNEFKESDNGRLTLYTNDIKVVIAATPTSAIGDLPLEEYAFLLSDSIGFLTKIDTDVSIGTPAYEYTLEGDDFVTSKCLLSLYKNEDLYYSVTFSCAEESYESNKDQFLIWMKSINI